jgi:hypothetical protein
MFGKIQDVTDHHASTIVPWLVHGGTAGNMLLGYKCNQLWHLSHQHLLMDNRTVSIIRDINSIFTWLIAWQDSNAYICCKRLKLYKYIGIIVNNTCLSFNCTEVSIQSHAQETEFKKNLDWFQNSEFCYHHSIFKETDCVMFCMI